MGPLHEHTPRDIFCSDGFVMSTYETKTSIPFRFQNLITRLFLVAGVAVTLAWTVGLVWFAGYEIGIW